ncbi:hypothetical protein, partial [Salmonella enterica]|uniref:hypothetical protein n=1 Tax=Salmonella enterica TaxID=28901 RepID=UPI001E5597D5
SWCSCAVNYFWEAQRLPFFDVFVGLLLVGLISVAPSGNCKSTLPDGGINALSGLRLRFFLFFVLQG